MKKQKLLLYAILLMAMALPQSIFAYDFSAVAPTGQTLYYDILSSSTVSVACPNINDSLHFIGGPWYGFSKPSGALTIPSSVTYGGTTYTVTEIGRLAFAECSSLTAVTIPTSIVSIGAFSFSGCISLTAITIPSSVTHIHNGAFGFCTGLSTVNYNADSCTTYDVEPFYGDTNITTIIIGQNVRVIPAHAFPAILPASRQA